MASILDRYGIKEVADVVFCKINEDGTRGAPVLYLDTLKVSTIEQTAESTDARGGKGNPKLVSWDYGKEINVSIEDALFSAKSMSIMFGDGNTPNEVSGTVERTALMRVADDDNGNDYFVADMYDAESKTSVRKNVWFADKVPTGQEGVTFAEVIQKNLLTITGIYDEASNSILTSVTSAANWTQKRATYKGQKVFVTYKLQAKSRTITISGDSFPGTYYIAGDTYARSDVTGADQFFQFIIPKAKVTSENTITLEAEGDPAVFNMNLTVLRPDDGVMMKLVQYTLETPTAG
jgi:hypothetical protein